MLPSMSTMEEVLHRLEIFCASYPEELFEIKAKYFCTLKNTDENLGAIHFMLWEKESLPQEQVKDLFTHPEKYGCNTPLIANNVYHDEL